jgi:hypothetical protein
MAFEPGGMADKLGNRYEGRWVAKQLLRLLNEEIQSITIEMIGPNEQGVDLLIVKKDDIRQLQQCKARFGSSENWSIQDLKNKGILPNLKNHLVRDPQQEFALISPIPARNLADICESARNSNDNPRDFYQYQIQNIGRDRRELFRKFCDGMELDPTEEHDLVLAFRYLRGTYFDLFPDDRNTWLDILSLAGFLLTGEPETAVSVLLTYAENKDRYRKPIYPDELRQYLAETHQIYPKQLQHDLRIGPAIESLQDEFSESIRPLLISNKVIPRNETAQIIGFIENGQDVVVHGAAGFGKSGVLYELTEYFEKQKIPYVPVRLDRRIPNTNARLFGESMGLPDSPANCLAGWASGRQSVLILDQLDALRWTASNSAAAMNVCKELVRQVRSLRRGGKIIVIVFACRTFDLENDLEIKNLLSKSENQSITQVSIKEFSDEQLKEILGSDIASLTNSQKRILAMPQNLAIWMQLKQEGMQPDFHSANELMRRFWENRRQILEQKAGISAEQLNEFLHRLLNFMESSGEISAPAVITQPNPKVRDALISYGVLQQGQNRISFCHQRYLDYLIAERLLLRIYERRSTITDWLGGKEKQTLFRREQLRQVLASLADESPSEFFNNAKTLLESVDVRFHLKHLVLEMIGQMDEGTEDIGKYCLARADDSFWQDHMLETVFLGHHWWVSYLLKAGAISKWLSSVDERRVNQALLLLRSVAEHIPDQVTEILRPLVNTGGVWPGRALNTICWNESEDSEQMFEFRLQLIRIGYVKDFVDWKSLCAKHPLRAIRLIEAVVSLWQVDNEDITKHRNSRLETWYDQDLDALNSAVKGYPVQTWDLLMPHVERLTNIQTSHYDLMLVKWLDRRFSDPETEIARGVVELLILSGQSLASEQPDELIAHTAFLEKSISPVVQEIIIKSYSDLPVSHANKGIQWLLADSARFRLGSGYGEPEWMPAVHLITALSPHCSKELFRQLEESIIHYHAPEEKREAEYCLKGWKEGYFGYYWGETQYFLLPALDSKRIQPATADLIRVLERKFSHYSKENFIKFGISSGGWIGSNLDPDLDRISDRAWLKIVCSQKVKEQGNHKWIQVDSDHALETNIHQFASSLARIAKRFPERFGRLVLQFPEDVHPSYISAILNGLSRKQPGEDVPSSEKETWEPARLETIEAVLDKYQAGNDWETASSFCWLIAERADENWSIKTIARLVDYARNHPDLEIDKLNVYSDKNSDEATIEILFQNTINCVRGVAAGAIGKLLWNRQGWMEQVLPGIEALVHDPHPVVRMAALEAIYPVLNIDKDLAVQWFCEACNDDLRVAASPRALPFFNYIIPSYIDQVGPMIQKMVYSPLDEVASQGARQVTARWLFHDYFENEFIACCTGTAAQRKGVADVSSFLLNNKKYSGKCQDILCQFMNDSDKDVRNELHHMFRDINLFDDLEYQAFIRKYIKSQAFADDPDHFVRSIKGFAGNLLSVADAIFAICEEFSTSLKDKTRDIGSRYPDIVSEISSVLLRLYEQVEGEHNQQLTATRCLDIWDMLFENRVGRTIELTKAIEQ